MNMVYLIPKKGRAVVCLAIFTKNQLGVSHTEETKDLCEPIDMWVSIADAGYFDLSVIEEKVLQLFEPKEKKWNTDGGTPPTFVPITEEFYQHLAYNEGVTFPDKPNKSEVVSDNWTPCVVIADCNNAGRSQPSLRKLIAKECSNTDDSAKVPGLPMKVTVGTAIAEAGGETGKYSQLDSSRFEVGIWNKGHFHCGITIPIGVDPVVLLAKARSFHSDFNTSIWIYNPPSAIEFESTPELYRQIQKELTAGGIAAKTTKCRFTFMQYVSDGGDSVPEAINCKMYDKKGTKFAGRPALWVMDHDGNPVDRGTDAYNSSKSGQTGNAAMYAGKTVAVRFWIEDPNTDRYHMSSFKGCTAYAVKFKWYEDLMAKHRPDVLENWERPAGSDPEVLHFLASDWCMRTDAHAKAGTAGTALDGHIDLASQPRRSMSQWLIGAYRQKFSSEYGEFPGVKTYKHKVSSSDLMALMAYNEEVST